MDESWMNHEKKTMTSKHGSALLELKKHVVAKIRQGEEYPGTQWASFNSAYST